MDFDNKFFEFEKKMRAEKIPDVAIQNFKYYYTQLVEGNTGLIHASEIHPIKSLPNSETLPEKCAQLGKSALPHVANIRLNGGLGTSMGLDKAKSLIKVKNNFSFLDIVALQVQQIKISLILMNSFVTREDSIALLSKNHPNLTQGNFPLDFLQHKIPKIRKSDLSPVVWEKDPNLEWCPPGHGDVYAALVTSGTLDWLIQSGIKSYFKCR
jgi:UTP--glucose-1-phosphate uridylyltransferase